MQMLRGILAARLVGDCGAGLLDESGDNDAVTAAALAQACDIRAEAAAGRYDPFGGVRRNEAGCGFGFRKCGLESPHCSDGGLSRKKLSDPITTQNHTSHL